MRDRALNYLAAGLTETATASALGVSLPLISSFTADPQFLAIVKAKRLEAAKHSEELQTNYATAQLKLSQKLLTLVNEDYPWTAAELVKVSETLDKLQDKYRPQKQSDAATQQLNIVQLVMPASMVARYTTNASNEIIAVNDTLLQTINSQQLIKDITEETQNAATAQLSDTAEYDALLESASPSKGATSNYRFSYLPAAESSTTVSNIANGAKLPTSSQSAVAKPKLPSLEGI